MSLRSSNPYQAKDDAAAVEAGSTLGPLDSRDRSFLRELFGERLCEQIQTPPHGSRSTGVLTLLTSHGFQVEMAEPALDGALTLGKGEACSDELRAWVGRVFAPRFAPAADRLGILADVIDSAPISRLLDGGDILWSATGLACALRRSSVQGFLCRYATAGAYLSAVARGLRVLDADGVEFAPALQDIQPGKDGLWLTLSLDPALASASPYCRVDFGVVTNSPDPFGELRLDYGRPNGEQDRISLSPRGRARYCALIATTGLKGLRWRIDDQPYPARVTVLTARPASAAAIEAQMLTVAGDEGVRRFRSLAELLTADAAAGAVQIELSRFLTRHIGGHVGTVRNYQTWIRRHEPDGSQAQADWRERLGRLEDRPRISLIICAATFDDRLAATIESLSRQIYPAWELVITHRAGDELIGSRSEQFASLDPRITVVACDDGDIAHRLNHGLANIMGEWIARIAEGDSLPQQALLMIAEMISAHRDAEIIYTDEDRIDAAGNRQQPHFKPDFSPELLLAGNYFGQLTLYKANTARLVGGWRVGFSPQEDYDLVLRIIDRSGPRVVRHSPMVLHHAGSGEGSTQQADDEAGGRALAEHLTRSNLDARISLLPSGAYRVRHAMPAPPPMVSLIIPTRDKADLLSRCVDSILETSTYPSYELLVVDNGSTEAKTKVLFDRLGGKEPIRILQYPGPFNFSAINNFAVRETAGSIVGFVNNDIEVITPGWIEELVSWAANPTIGCVGAKLYYADKRVQHAGIMLGVGGVAGHSHKYYSGEDPGYFSRLIVHQNVSAVTGACLFVKRSLFDAVGGFDEALTVAFNDVDLCLRIADLGVRNVFTPFAELYHHESLSRGADDTPVKAARFAREYGLMRRRWGERLANDPYYSPNLTLVKEDFDLRWMDE